MDSRTTLPPTDPILLVQSTLGTTYRVRISDGRLFTGSFVALDPQGNLVLDQGIEYAPRTTSKESHIATESNDYTEGRDVGLVLLPMKEWVTVEREVEKDARTEGLTDGGDEGCLPH